MKHISVVLITLNCLQVVAAQTKKIDSAGLIKPVINSGVKIKIIAPTAQQTSTAPITNVFLTPPKQTATGILFEPPTEGKDLKITIDKIEDNSNNTNSIYAVHYSIINTGTIDIDITNIVLQGVFNKIGTAINLPAGGSILPPAELGSHAILHPGERFQGKRNAFASGIFVNTPYKYILSVDEGNRIPEANENNNTGEIMVPPHKQPDLVVGNLKVAYNLPLGRWEISYMITNTGNYPIDLNYVSFQGYFIAVIPYGPPEGGCGFNLGSSSGPTMLNPGENYAGSFFCSQNRLHSGKEYDYTLTFSSNFPVPDLNLINNKATLRVTAP